MTDSLALPGGQLLAADTIARTIEGILVPYGEPGRTNLGRRAVRRGALRLAAAVVGINGHDRDQPVSRLVDTDDRPEGLWGRLRVARTSAGDQLLAEAADGIRSGLSIEASELQFDAATGDVIDGFIDYVAHVPVPAYDTARADRITAAASPNPTPTGEPSVTAPTPPAPEAPALAAVPALDYAALAAELGALLGPQLSAAAVPNGLPTSSLQASPGLAPSAPAAPDAEDPLDRFATLQAEVFRGTATPEMRAALADITNTGLSIFQNPSVIGEKLWEGAGYTRRFTGLLRNKPLTAWKGTGWQWVNRPKLQDYAGDKAAIPTNTVSVSQVPWEAERVAGGWDIDRKLVDFGDSEFWKELLVATTESYLEISDAKAAAALVGFALDVTVDANVPTGYAAINVAQADVLKAVALGTAILEDTPRVRRGPDYVLMNTSDWLDLVNITNLDVPAFLRLLKVAPENFQRTSEVAAGTVVLGVQPAATFRELSGNPIRVTAQNIPQGGVDEGAFGYVATSLDRPGGIISVPLA